jgi:hypothetical protein
VCPASVDFRKEACLSSGDSPRGAEGSVADLRKSWSNLGN